MKLPAHRAGLPENEILFFIVPLDPAYKAGLAGHLPVSVSFFKWGKPMDHTGLFSLNGKCGFVTGPTRGPGEVIALGLAQYGASLVQRDIDDPEKKDTRSRKWLGMIGYRAFGILGYTGSF